MSPRLLRSAGCGQSAIIGLLVGLVVVGPARAQPKPSPPIPPPAAPPATAPAAEWGSFPSMLLEKVYRGPLRDTIIQRWRDPIDGSVCFVYLPISAPLLPQAADGYVQYGANQIGSISCVHPTQVLQLWQGGGAPPPVPAPASRR